MAIGDILGDLIRSMFPSLTRIPDNSGKTHNTKDQSFRKNVKARRAKNKQGRKTRRK